MTVPLVGFATKPWDFDSACIAVMVGNGNSETNARSCRGMGAHHRMGAEQRHRGLVDAARCPADPVQVNADPRLRGTRPTAQGRLNPVSLYRGKTIALLDKLGRSNSWMRIVAAAARGGGQEAARSG